MAGSAAYYVAGALLAYGAYESYQSAQSTAEAAKYQRQALATQQKSADLKAYNERINAIREARIRRATIVAGAAGAGAQQSSGLAGATSSVSSQLGSNLSFMDQLQSNAQQTTIFNMKSVGAQSDAATSAAYSDISFKAFGLLAGGRSIFDKSAWTKT